MNKYKNILVVNPDLPFQKKIERAALQLGGEWKFHGVVDGAGALASLNAPGVAFDLMLLDVDLPDMSGVDVVAKARQSFPDLPVLAVTSSRQEECFLSAIRAGARGYLLKGDVTVPLARSIEQVLQGQNPVSPDLVPYLFRLASSTASPPVSNRFNLSPRELELLDLLSKGVSYADCAKAMRISLSTVQTHIRNMYRKLNVSNHRQAIHKALGAEMSFGTPPIHRDTAKSTRNNPKNFFM